MIELFEVTYWIPGKGSVTSKNNTREGVRQTMRDVLRAGGTGCAVPQVLDRLIARGLASRPHP